MRSTGRIIVEAWRGSPPTKLWSESNTRLIAETTNDRFAQATVGVPPDHHLPIAKGAGPRRPSPGSGGASECSQGRQPLELGTPPTCRKPQRGGGISNRPHPRCAGTPPVQPPLWGSGMGWNPSLRPGARAPDYIPGLLRSRTSSRKVASTTGAMRLTRMHKWRALSNRSKPRQRLSERGSRLSGARPSGARSQPRSPSPRRGLRLHVSMLSAPGCERISTISTLNSSRPSAWRRRG
jgi:hypothetical protein